MRKEFAGRSVVCLVTMPPTALDLAKIEASADVGRPKTQVINEQLAVAEYERFRVLLVPDGRAQVDFAPNISRGVCRKVAQEFLKQVAPFNPRGVGFNGAMMLNLDDEGDAQPAAGLVDGDAIAALLKVEGEPRIGTKLIYAADDSARLTFELVPIDDDPTSWQANINRHYAGPVGEAEFERGISWLAAVNDEISELVGRMPRGAHVAD